PGDPRGTCAGNGPWRARRVNAGPATARPCVEGVVPGGTRLPPDRTAREAGPSGKQLVQGGGSLLGQLAPGPFEVLRRDVLAGREHHVLRRHVGAGAGVEPPSGGRDAPGCDASGWDVDIFWLLGPDRCSGPGAVIGSALTIQRGSPACIRKRAGAAWWRAAPWLPEYLPGRPGNLPARG